MARDNKDNKDNRDHDDEGLPVPGVLAVLVVPVPGAQHLSGPSPQAGEMLVRAGERPVRAGTGLSLLVRGPGRVGTGLSPLGRSSERAGTGRYPARGSSRTSRYG